MAAASYNLTIEQGADFGLAFTYYPDGTDEAPQDWTGWTGEAQIRPGPGARLLASFDVTLSAEGVVGLALSAAQTRELPTKGTHKWDLELTRTSDGYVMRLLGGRVTVTGEITE